VSINFVDQANALTTTLRRHPGYTVTRCYFISLDRMNSFLSSDNYKKFFSFLAADFWPKNLAFPRKNNGFARVWGCSPPALWLVRLGLWLWTRQSAAI